MDEFAKHMAQLSPDEQHEVWEVRNRWGTAVFHQEVAEQIIRRVMLAEKRGQPLEDVDKHVMKLKYREAVMECHRTASPLFGRWPWGALPLSPPYEERSDADVDLALEVLEYTQDLFPAWDDLHFERGAP